MELCGTWMTRTGRGFSCRLFGRLSAVDDIRADWGHELMPGVQATIDAVWGNPAGSAIQ